MRSGRSLWCLLLALFLLAGIRPADAQGSLMRPVVDPKGRFTIDFPADWHVLKPNGGMIAVLGVATARKGPNPASVNVVVEDLPGTLSPEHYAGLSERMLRAVFHDYTPVQEGSATIGGQAAYYRYYTWQTNTGVILYQLQVYFTVDRRGFVITGSTLNDPQHTRIYVPVITQIIESFRPAGRTYVPDRRYAFLQLVNGGHWPR